MTDQSPEAVVAGQAAAAAVEEVQERQALVEDVTQAVVSSAVAEETAKDAETVASMAAQEVGQVAVEASVAASVAGTAVEAAEEAREIAAGSADYAHQAFVETQKLRQENEQFRTELFNLLSPKTEQPAEGGVEEVEVNDNSGSEATPEEDTPDAASTDSVGSGERRYGRRVRRGKRA